MDRATNNGHEPQALEAKVLEPAPLAQADVLDQVAAVVERAAVKSDSMQPRFTQPASFFNSVFRWVQDAELTHPHAKASVREWDAWYRRFSLAEPHLAGVINSVIQIDKNRGWTITGGRNQVSKYTAILRDADEGQGWRYYSGWQAQSYYTTRMGFVTEVGRDGEAGPARGLWSVDPARCELTGIPDSPLKYYPMTGGAQDWQPSDFFRQASLTSTDERMHSLGFPAVARCLDLAEIMIAVYQHDKEQLGARAPRGLLLLHGINDTDWATAMEAREESLSALERQYYGGVAVLATTGSEEIKAELIALSQLPKDFDLQVFTDLLMYGYALAFGYDPREFWPVSSGALGTATETETQHRKASSKGDLDFSLAHQEQIQNVLPASLLFEYQQRDVQGEVTDAQLQLAKAQVITEINKWTTDGTSRMLNTDQILQLAAEQGIIPEEWTPSEEDVTGTDVDPEGVTRAIDRQEVRRALELFPDEPIVRYAWPSGKIRTLARRGGDVMKRRSFPTVRRSIDSVVSRFRNDLFDIVNSALSSGGSITRDMRGLVKAAVEDAYIEGLQEGGISASEMDEEDAMNIVQLDLTQQDFITGFSAAVRTAAAEGTADAKNAVLHRVDLWAQSIAAAGTAGLNSARSNEMVRFGGTDGAESCRDCQKFKNEAHRRKWFTQHNMLPATPGSALECQGYQCAHVLEPIG